MVHLVGVCTFADAQSLVSAFVVSVKPSSFGGNSPSVLFSLRQRVRSLNCLPMCTNRRVWMRGTNVSCQLNFWPFVSYQLNLRPFVSCQLIGC